jgi:Uma2 family endonuclease
MPSALQTCFVPLDEYYTLDTEGAAERWEWRKGEVFCMTGAQPEHNLICINIGAELRARLRGSGCLTFTSDQRFKVRAGSPYLYLPISPLPVRLGTPPSTGGARC